MGRKLEEYTALLAEIKIEEQKVNIITDDGSVTTELKKAGIKDRLGELLKVEEKEYEELTGIINALPRGKQRQVMFARYIDGLPWKVINQLIFGERQDFEEKKDNYQRTTYRIHGRALIKSDEIIKKNR
nr:MAG TPA: Protein of unknown function (DUF1492) [Caudoviricetes sp.]